MFFTPYNISFTEQASLFFFGQCGQHPALLDGGRGLVSSSYDMTTYLAKSCLRVHKRHNPKTKLARYCMHHKQPLITPDVRVVLLVY